MGLEAQRKAVEDYLNGGNWTLDAEFTEVESGRIDERPQLEAAKKLCKKIKATLVIAKLDRLSRDVHFITGLMKSGVEFVACDNPHANKMTLQMLAVFAEHERDMISKRTREALAALKAQGKVWAIRTHPHLWPRGGRDRRQRLAKGLQTCFRSLRN